MEASLVVLCDERCGCVPDLADAQTAILSKFDSSHDIIAALRRLESLPQEELQSLRRRAYARAELFRPEAVAQKIMQDITLLLDPSAGK
jgi:glycosyltransferase involved in cell wall biosynthesis